MPAKSCSHIVADGHVCGSPAMRGTLFCYYHSRDRQRTRILRRRAQKKNSPDADVQVLAALNLPTPDNPVATQVCIASILQAMMTGVISGPLGGRFLYGLHMAKCNYREVDAFQKRFLDEDVPIRVVPIAASDPEPIVDPDAGPEERSSETEELKQYAKALKVEHFERTSIDGEITEAECSSDSHFIKILDRLSKDDELKQSRISELRSAYQGDRRAAREIIFGMIHDHLDRIELASREPSSS